MDILSINKQTKLESMMMMDHFILQTKHPQLMNSLDEATTMTDNNQKELVAKLRVSGPWSIGEDAIFHSLNMLELSAECRHGPPAMP
jgi:hypothetical protein